MDQSLSRTAQRQDKRQKARILDAARANVDKTEIECFFAEYMHFLKENPLPATRIYNYDETGIGPQDGSPKDIDRFVENIPPARPVLLTLENHSAHIALEVLEKFKDNQIEISSLPPHTTRILQSLDAGYYRSFKSKWRDIADYLSEATWAACGQKQMVAGFVREAIKRAWKDDIKDNSWLSIGLWPVDPSKAFSKQFVSKNATPTSTGTSFVLTNDPLPIDDIKPRDLLRLKREGIDASSPKLFQ
ncbi:hypothetical protein ON010_g5882 [Phytophthora cinnamomi]|nr:hypothetical protein ON010_g5882 [Phytophthora cinnamomi]